MRIFLVAACVASLSLCGLAQQSASSPASDDSKQFATPSSDPRLNEIFQAKIKAEWEALKNKDKNAYAELLADDYQGVEVDGKGERTKTQALNELAGQNVFNYTLGAFRLIPLGADAAFIVYESTIQFPPGAQMRFSRVYITELWVKRGSEWKELHYQETHVK